MIFETRARRCRCVRTARFLGARIALTFLVPAQARAETVDLGRPNLRSEDAVRQRQLLLGHDVGGLRYQQVDPNPCGQQAFEQTQAIGHARGAGQG